ncbi:MAG: ATP-binding cassette domain-containing protein [Bacteroidetes bacterium]|nr:MAG: ATP-binding cassette domain-containing protein [Bacteroidota bacterium]TNE97597.1 MAG: ATP-binding cassette domain-containing protein [Bacteroidota bacterium]
MIRVEQLGVKRDKWVLRGIDIEFLPGERVGIIGKSGAGKSTFLKAISGMLDVQEGGVYYNNKKIIGPSVKLVPGYEEVQLVDQEFRLDPYHTVEENIREALLFLDREERDDQVESYLQLTELSGIRNVKAHLISGGEKQRLAIVRALSTEPDMLILDEPFVHLDSRMRDKMMEHISRIQQSNGMGLVIASHDGAELMGFVDKIAYLNNGGIRRFEDATEMYYRPESKEEAELLGYVNEINVNGELILFRPNQYSVVEDGITLNLESVKDRGGILYHHYRTQKGEGVLLYSMNELSPELSIDVNKEWRR